MKPEDHPLWKYINSDFAATEKRIFDQFMGLDPTTIDLVKGKDGVFRQEEENIHEYSCKDIPIGITSRFVFLDEADGPDETVYQRRSPNGETATRRITSDWKQSRDPMATLESIRSAIYRIPYTWRDGHSLLNTNGARPVKSDKAMVDFLRMGIPILPPKKPDVLS